jgi:hypothetical protein
LQRWEQNGPYDPANHSPSFLQVGHLVAFMCQYTGIPLDQPEPPSHPRPRPRFLLRFSCRRALQFCADVQTAHGNEVDTPAVVLA